jgi:hypothetical protein
VPFKDFVSCIINKIRGLSNTSYAGNLEYFPSFHCRKHSNLRIMIEKQQCKKTKEQVFFT